MQSGNVDYTYHFLAATSYQLHKYLMTSIIRFYLGILCSIISSTAMLGADIKLLYQSGNEVIQVDGFDRLQPFSQQGDSIQKLSSNGVFRLQGKLETILNHGTIPLYYHTKTAFASETNIHPRIHESNLPQIEHKLSILSRYKKRPYDGLMVQTLLDVWGDFNLETINVIVAWFDSNETLLQAQLLKLDNLEMLIQEDPVAFRHEFKLTAPNKRVPIVLLMDDNGAFLLPQPPSAPFPHLLTAILQNDLSRFEEELDHDPSILGRMMNNGFRLADLVAAFGDAEFMRAAIRHQAPIHEHNRDGTSPIHLAALHNKPEIIDVLLQAGTDVNLRDETRNNPIHVAIATSAMEACEVLIAANCDLNKSNQFGAKPVDVAGNTSTPGLIKILHNAGARLKLTALEKQRLLIRSLLYDDLETAQFLIELGAKTTEPYRQTYPIHQAARSSSGAILKLLIENGADVNQPDADQNTPLMIACAANFKAVQILIEQGADVNAKNSQGYSSLHTAIFAKQPETVRLLLAHGADPNMLDGRGKHLMLFAAEFGSNEMFSELVTAGARCDLDETEVLPLMEYAFRNNILEFVDMSLSTCLNPDFRFFDFLPSTWVADYYGKQEIWDLLVARGVQATMEEPVFADPSSVRGKVVSKHVKPVPYPPHLQQKYGAFHTRVAFLIDPMGKVRLPKPIDNPAVEMDDLIIDTLNQWQFEPIVIEDQPMWAKIRLPLLFEPTPPEENIYEIDAVVTMPKPTKMVEPAYPSILKRKRINGEVLLAFIVDEEGYVVNPTVETSSHKAFEKSALVSISQWKFEPGYMNGEPVKVRIRVPLIYKVH